MLHDVLWRSSFHLAQSCLLHPFVRALSDGRLPADLFRAYIAQDAFFLRAFAQVYALALARSSDLETIALYSELIGGVQEELNLHRVYTAELAIDLGSVVPNPACRAYTDFLLRTAWHNSLGETLAATTPCMRLYAFLGEELVPKLRATPSVSEVDGDLLRRGVPATGWPPGSPARSGVRRYCGGKRRLPVCSAV